jgi:hypothetical protein
MNRGRYRWLFRLAVLLAVGAGFLLWAWYRDRSPILTVENRSGQPIAELRVTAGGDTSTARDVQSDAEVATPLRTKGADHFVVEGRLADGTLVRGRFGLTAGGESLRLVVMPGGQIVPRPAGK